MKKFVFSILIVSFAIRAMATSPIDKWPAIVIDTIHVSSGALVIDYEVLRPFDHVNLTIQSSWSMALRDAKPVLLSGNPGKGRTSVPVHLITDEAIHFNVFIAGGQFANRDDTFEYDFFTFKIEKT